jgi:hypothetical protein
VLWFTLVGFSPGGAVRALRARQNTSNRGRTRQCASPRQMTKIRGTAHKKAAWEIDRYLSSCVIFSTRWIAS